MFLKRIESLGFKSFAEQINVEFVPGVTAVVGPNGSGKSNITDAIRWVLGEQSAKSLRGAKMEDIIFQGSDSRKPLNMAEVTLVLDNSDRTLAIDYQEVSVTRRIYRSGESEFLINKQSCRLKDIVDLFLDSGLGREAFSIISQGKVEEILSSKPAERRIIFEEAAGVLKYKNRKKKAEYKLAETQENLNRVDDIVHEIEGQLEPLKEQAAIAKDYLTKKEELKEVEISLLIAEIESFHSEWESLLEELKNHRLKEQELRESVETKQRELEQQKNEMDILDEKLDVLQEKLLVLTQELENLEGKKQLASERHKNLEQNKQQAEKDITNLTERIAVASSEYRKEKGILKELEKKRKETKKLKDDLSFQLTHTHDNISDQIEELKSEYIERLNEQAAKRNEKQSIERQLDQITRKQKLQSEKFKEYLIEREELEQKQKEHDQLLERATLSRKETEQKVASLKEKLQDSKSDYQDSQSKLYQGYQHIEKLKSKKEMLEEMRDSYQGFFHGVKEVLKAGKDGPLTGMVGAVIELIDVPKKFIMAMETALGAQAQHVVTEDEQAARKAITWLKQTNKGRATFLPITSIRAKYIPTDLLQKARSQKGYIGTAAELVSYQPVYQQIIENLLGNVIIAQSLEEANRIASILHNRYRIVTVEGDVVNPGGSMTGGAQKKSGTSLFSRDSELEEITEKLTLFTERTIEFERKVQDKKRDIEEKETELEKMQTERDKWKTDEQEAKSASTEVTYKLNSLNENLILYDQDTKQFQFDNDQLEEQYHTIAKELEQLEGKIDEIQTTIDSLSQQLSERQVDQEQIQKSYHSSQITLAEQETKERGQKEKVSVLEKSLRELEIEKEAAVTRLEMLNGDGSPETEEEIEEKLQTKKVEKEKISASLQEKKQRRQSLAYAHNALETSIKEENRIHQGWLQSIQEKEVRTNRLDVELENRLQRLQEEYVISFEKAKKDFQKTIDITEAKRSVKLIKRSIDELGTVNIGAIEEYQRIEERYRFLYDQREDLMEAKSTLYGVIKEMDNEMATRFLETFQKIKAEFTVVFQQLFGGGKAELKLTEPDDLLVSGVEIIAQPPGKKLQHLGLLSGGEKALTAIALLFSILRIRPVPFCILDEVEAALDDANVTRFAKYLQEYSDQTQFIVITHRKGTMEEADVLYGVTMQEAGVSRLVSVKLEDASELVKV